MKKTDKITAKEFLKGDKKRIVKSVEIDTVYSYFNREKGTTVRRAIVMMWEKSKDGKINRCRCHLWVPDNTTTGNLYEAAVEAIERYGITRGISNHIRYWLRAA